MRFRIRHETHYRYGAPVALGPHVLRLRPREDGVQRLIGFDLEIFPAPATRCVALDAAGNVVEHAWFAGQTRELRIVATAEVETLRRNPFDYVPAERDDNAAPLLAAYGGAGQAPEVEAFAAAASARAGPGAVAALDALNQAIHARVHREIRDDGRPAQTAAETLALGRGACRDLTVLFMACARALGYAARFVSGYRRGDLARPDRHLHAWAEAYVPGGGWRGWDPVEALAVADAHVALAAAPGQDGTMPVSGAYRGEASAALEYAVRIAVD
jgi:transglutaminase-like putative cysteine protease